MDIEKLVELLKRIPGVQSIVVGETYPQCIEVTGSYNDNPFFIYIYRGRYSNSPILRITPTPKSCIEALTTPEGLYTIPYRWDNETLIKSLEVKIKAVTSRSRHQT